MRLAVKAKKDVNFPSKLRKISSSDQSICQERQQPKMLIQQTKCSSMPKTFDLAGNQITKKIREGDVMYFKKRLAGKKSFQVVVNTPNVILYAASK